MSWRDRIAKEMMRRIELSQAPAYKRQLGFIEGAQTDVPMAPRQDYTTMTPAARAYYDNELRYYQQRGFPDAAERATQNADWDAMMRSPNYLPQLKPASPVWGTE